MTDRSILKTLVPINTLASAHYEELAAEASISNVPKGKVLFKHGATDNDTIYLLSGEIELIPAESRHGRTIIGGSEQARYPLSQLKPRQFTGKTKTTATIASVASDLLDRLLTWDQVTGEYEVTELADVEDAVWAMQVLRNRAFQTLPATNINKLFERLEPVVVKTGQVIIKQDEVGDYFYIVKQGTCRVARKSEQSGKVAMLSELSEGASFGEEALLSDAPRNATVIMATDGVLMRLSKKDFDELLREPLVRWIGPSEAKKMIRDGAGLLDVRTEEEYKQGGLKGSANLPLYLLRLKVLALDQERPYIVCCETGNRSSAAAFLLSERGFDVYVLRGGLVALREARQVATT
ncbi:MAG: cyclic nucleotide-binding domain-containing protein [Acidiferrobacterales bacterium]